jgi:hypothetical protein
VEAVEFLRSRRNPGSVAEPNFALAIKTLAIQENFCRRKAAKLPEKKNS